MTLRPCDFEKIGANLYRRGNSLYRYAFRGTTPNGCWHVGAEMICISDICISTGKDILTGERIQFEIGVAPAV